MLLSAKIKYVVTFIILRLYPQRGRHSSQNGLLRFEATLAVSGKNMVFNNDRLLAYCLQYTVPYLFLSPFL